MKSIRLRQLAVGLSLALVLTPAPLSHSQERAANRTPAPVEAKAENWKTFSSTEGRFSIEFPGIPKVSTQTIEHPPAKFVLTQCTLETELIYGVIYADYPTKIEGATEVNRILNDGAKGGAASINAELVSMTEITVDGYPGRLLYERTGNGATMTAKMVLAGQRLYQIAVTFPEPTKVTPEEKPIYDTAANRFLDSFKITNTVQKPGEGDEWLLVNGNAPAVIDQAATDSSRAMNTRALWLPKPRYPPKARAANAMGTVKVKVLIDEKGDVIAAQAVSGDPLLHDVSVEAARASRFAPYLLDGKAIKVTGFLLYNFVEAQP